MCRGHTGFPNTSREYNRDSCLRAPCPDDSPGGISGSYMVLCLWVSLRSPSAGGQPSQQCWILPAHQTSKGSAVLCFNLGIWTKNLFTEQPHRKNDRWAYTLAFALSCFCVHSLSSFSIRTMWMRDKCYAHLTDEDAATQSSWTEPEQISHVVY